jgi:hypothetical protein
MAKKQGILLAVIAFTAYILGGFGTFGGIGLIMLMQDRNLLGWGDGRAIGYLLLCVGLCLSILGVLMMRLFRNRGLT